MLFSKRNLITITAVFIALLATSVLPTTVLAHNKVVVITLGGDEQKPLKNVITVAKKNGDFTDPIAAMASITDASAANPYLMVIAPGVYTIPQNRSLRIKSYVDVTGSGQNSTFLRGNSGSDSTNSPSNGTGLLVSVSDNSSISSLTIENLGTTLTYGFGVSINSGTLNSDPASLSNVTINVSSRSNSQLTGLKTRNGNVTVFNSKINVSAGSGGRATGISNILTSLNVLSTEIELSGSASSKTGISSFSSLAQIQSSSINAPSGTSIRVYGTGLSQAYISNSFLTGNVLGSQKCSFVFTLAGAALNDSCL